MNILQLSCHFRPNVGGVETHLNDLVTELVRKKHNVFVLTYRPLMSDAKWKILEKQKGLTIFRIPWIKGYFYKLVKSPIVEFMYLLPGLFIVLPFVLFIKKFDVIHSHGLVAGFVGMFWGKVFDIKTVVSTHSVYEFPKNGLYPFFVKWMFNSTDKVLTLSKQSKKELVGLGVDEKKIGVFTYWVDLDRFKVTGNKLQAKKKLKWKYKFVVLFVGRLVEEKGILILLEAAKKWNKNITLVIVGTGPLEKKIRNSKSEIRNIKFIGRVENDELPKYYNAADVTIVPSIHEEGFGRVILESLACGTPVIGSNRGAIPEAMDETVGKLINVTPENIKDAVGYCYEHPEKLMKSSKKARIYAEQKYGSENVRTIINYYIKK